MTDLKPKKILILETDENISRIMLPALAASGFEVIIAYDAASLQREAMLNHPDLVIVDVGMADVDGFAALDALKNTNDSLVSNIPVIIGSAQGDLVEISRGLRLGIKDYFVKSTFDPTQLVAKIMKQLGDASPVSPSFAPQPNVPTQKLLIIEDDKFLRDLAVQKLNKESLRVFAAVDGEQGIALAESELPDLILLDILLPGIDGFEVLTRIRANPLLAKTHVAMLSNFGQREDVEKALGLGADEFLIKANYTLDEIVLEVKKILATPRRSGPRSTPQ